MSARQVWNRFCTRYDVHRTSVPLFECTGLRVGTRPFGRLCRPVLARSVDMDQLLGDLHAQLKADFTTKAGLLEGYLYFVLWLEGDQPVPLYIGKSMTLGRSGLKLNTDISDYRFGRWSDDPEQHIGELSTAVLSCEGANPRTTYVAWAERMFVPRPAAESELRRPVHFWALPWGPMRESVWPDLSPTSIGTEENLLIAVAKSAFPNFLLNSLGT